MLPTIPQDGTTSWAPRSSGGATSGTNSPRPEVADVGETAPFADLTATCAAAEAAGAAALWVCDHVFWHQPVLECMTALTVAALATRSAIVGTAVVQLPLRNPAVVAKQAAALQTATGGRVVLGVGVGSHPGEYEQAGADYGRRGHNLDVGIDALRRSWRSGDGVSTGDVDAGGAARYRQLPAPPPVPVWVGGSSEPALRRTAALADGWMPLFLDVEAYAAALERLSKELDRVGRPEGSVAASVVVFVSVDEDPEEARRRGLSWMSRLYGLPAKAFARHLVAGTAADVADRVDAYRRAGAEHVVVYVTDDRPLPQFGALQAALQPPDHPLSRPTTP
jgi:alkanesulfonate monooxygenase SsuD/methylene tetrahydromethanopterin reductase-like flavin-dependent oxidoreductase (luciferase family)